LKRNRIQKPRHVNFFQVPRQLWRRVKKHLPRRPRKRGPGRPRASDRAALNGIWYVLWTGCQWKAVHRDWFGVSSSVIHERFQTWQKQGIWEKVLRTMARYYARKRHIRWGWQSLDSTSCSSPLGGEQTGKNPTDRAKLGSKIHILVDQRGAPLAVHVTGTNEHDKWSVDDLIFSVVVPRPSVRQHLCADRGYDYTDVHQVVRDEHYIPHIKHRRKRGEPPDPCPVPGEHQYPARRWVVERTLAWLVKRRSIRTRWSKKADNWLALLQFACAHILHDMAIYG
jgi:putative transposase